MKSYQVYEEEMQTTYGFNATLLKMSITICILVLMLVGGYCWLGSMAANVQHEKFNKIVSQVMSAKGYSYESMKIVGEIEYPEHVVYYSRTYRFYLKNLTLNGAPDALAAYVDIDIEETDYILPKTSLRKFVTITKTEDEKEATGLFKDMFVKSKHDRLTVSNDPLD